MDLITLLLGALATARITRLITLDRLTKAPRAWITRRLPDDSLLAYLVHCGWCVSVYIGAGVAAVGAWAGAWTWVGVLPAALAFSYVAGWLASKDGE